MACTIRRCVVNLGDGTAILELTKGYFARVDLDDADLVAGYLWSVCEKRRKDGTILGVYAQAYIAGKLEYLHRVVMRGQGKAGDIDHVNHDGLDCRQSNLRFVSRALNNANQRKQARPTSSRFKGVSLDKRRGRWSAKIKIDGVPNHLGCFADEESAARAYDQAARTAWGQHAHLNLPESA